MTSFNVILASLLLTLSTFNPLFLLLTLSTFNPLFLLLTLNMDLPSGELCRLWRQLVALLAAFWRVSQTSMMMFFCENSVRHCMKSVQVRSYFWSVFSCIRTKYRKIRTRKNSVFAQFSRSDSCLTLCFHNISY